MNISRYLSPKPSRIQFRAFLCGFYSLLKRALKVLWFLFCHTFSIYDFKNKAESGISSKNPKGKFGKKHLEFAQWTYQDSLERMERVERKASLMLATLGVFSPLLILMWTQPLEKVSVNGVYEGLFQVLFTAIAFLIAFAFIACFRALSFHSYKKIGPNFLIDEDSEKVIHRDLDSLVRIRLYEALEKNAVVDHIADFVRAAQLYLVLSALCLLVLSVIGVFGMFSGEVHEDVSSPTVIIVPVTKI